MCLPTSQCFNAISRFYALLTAQAALEMPCKPYGRSFGPSETRAKSVQVFLPLVWETCFRLRKKTRRLPKPRTFPVRNIYS